MAENVINFPLSHLKIMTMKIIKWPTAPTFFLPSIYSSYL